MKTNAVIDGSKPIPAFVDTTIHVDSDQPGRGDHDNFDH